LIVAVLIAVLIAVVLFLPWIRTMRTVFQGKAVGFWGIRIARVKPPRDFRPAHPSETNQDDSVRVMHV